MRVTDDGGGMSRDDALMSVERHATSKIRDMDDLFALGTLGFRGEALPSIASVSRFRLTTAEAGAEEGTEIHIEGGVLKKVDRTAPVPGTSVEVKNLFFNTPARLKFLKKPETELSRVFDVIQREALSNPGVAFEAFSNGKRVHRYGSTESLRERVEQVIPGSALYEMDFEDGTLRVRGFLGSPLDPRSSMRSLFAYVNGRPIRDRFVNRIVMDSYGRTIEKGKYPRGVIFVERDPRLVDVNVHPTKSEVRFDDQYAVGRSLAKAIGGMLADAPWLKSHVERTKKALGDFYERQKVSAERDLPVPGFSAKGAARAPRDASSAPAGLGAAPSASAAGDETDMFAGGFYSRLRFLGQIGKLYLVCESPNGIMLVDQHAAHERVNFERVKNSYLDGSSSCSQELFVPEVVELSMRETACAGQFREEIQKLGFDYEVFGENAVRIKSVPGFLRDSDHAKVFRDLLDELDGLGRAKSLAQSLDTVCATVACHASITANRVLSEREARSLFADMDAAENPHSCPHGRPVAVELSLGELEKMFKRS